MNILIIGLLLLSVSLTVVPTSSINAQLLFPVQMLSPNEAAQQYLPPPGGQYNGGLTQQDYFYLIQLMQFYMNMYGPNNWQDRYWEDKTVIKIIDKDDDDDDDDKDHKDRDHKKPYWWKDKDHKDRDDKKKYCEGKGKWNGFKCVTDNEEDKTAWEDAVCDDGKKSKFCGNAEDKDDKKDRDRDADEDDKTENVEEEQQKEEESDDSNDDEDKKEESKDDDDSDDSDDGGDDGDDGGNGEE